MPPTDVVVFGNNEPSTLDLVVGVAGVSAAAATIIGVFFAVSRYFGSLGDRKKAQARLVYGVFDPYWAEVKDVGTSISRSNARPTKEPMPPTWVTIQEQPDGHWVTSAEVPLVRALIKVVNDSDEVITSIRAGVSSDKTLADAEFKEELPWMEPGGDGRTLVVWAKWNISNSVESAAPVVTFQDAAGHWWIRHLGHPVSALSKRQRKKHWSSAEPPSSWW